MTADYSLFIGICLMNPTLTNVGMGLQKLAINKMAAASAPPDRKPLYVSVWVSGLILQIVVMLLQIKALSLGNASTLGGFAGFGLVTLTIFSHLVLKEKILKRELAGMALIIAGTAMLGFFSHATQHGIAGFEQRRMTLFLAAFAVAATAALLFMFRDKKRYGGMILGMLGGCIGGLAIVFLKIAVSRFGGRFGDSGIALAILSDVYVWMALLGGVGGIVLVQFGYKFGKAIQVVPGFSSIIVIMPSLSGFLVLREILTVICVVSLAVIITGVLVATTADRSAVAKK